MVFPPPDPSPIDIAALFEQKLGFISNLFRAQASLPRAVRAEAGMVEAIVLSDGGLTRKVKELLVYSVAAARRSVYCATAHAHILETLGGDPSAADALLAGEPDAGLDPRERILIEFGLILGREPARAGQAEVQRCLDAGLGVEEILEAVQTVSLGRFMCVLAEGLAPVPDFPPRRLPSAGGPTPGPYFPSTGGAPYLPSAEIVEPPEFEPFAFFRKHFGFVPNIFRAQALRPDAVRAQAEAIRSILLPEDLLPRRLKEYILLVVSARNLNTYCVAVHCELLRGLGVPLETSDRIAVDFRQAGLSPAEVAMLDFIVSLHGSPEAMDRGKLKDLQSYGWSPEQILEGIVMASLSEFLNTIQSGLGSVPDFPVRIAFDGNAPAPVSPIPAPMGEPERPRAPDPDAGLVGRAQAGDLGAFEELVVRHQAKVYRVLLGMTGDPEAAAGEAQEVFLRAMTCIGGFSGVSRFSTWLTRIAIDAGLELMGSRWSFDPLPDEGRESAFRPTNVTPWVDRPEERFSRQELRQLVQRKIAELPSEYRAAVILRDLAQLSPPEAAAAMGLPPAVFKTRLLRGRLMLREALAPSFARRPGNEQTSA